MIGRPYPALGIAALTFLVFAALSLPGASTSRAAMLTAPLPVIDLDLPLPPRVEASPRARAEQGQIIYRHHSSRIVLDEEIVEQALGSLAPGTPVRLGLPGVDRALQGQFAGLDPEEVRVETRRGPESLDRAGIRRVWVGRPQTAKGALIGAVHGFAFGMLMGARHSSDFEADPGYPGGASRASQRSDLEEIGQLTFHWGLPVALIGAAVGAVIGSGVTGWQPVTP